MSIIFYTNVRERRPVKPPETVISSQTIDSAAERDSLAGEGWVPVSGYAGSRGFGRGAAYLARPSFLWQSAPAGAEVGGGHRVLRL